MAEEKVKELRIGDRVRHKIHKKLGIGKIIGYSDDVEDELIVQFPECKNNEEAFKHRGNSGWFRIENLEKVPEENKEWCKRCGAGDPFTMFPNDACYRCGAGVEYATDVKPEEADIGSQIVVCIIYR